MPVKITPRKIEKVTYGGWPNCYRLTNGKVDLVVTTDVGPRVIRYGFVGEQNLFAELAGHQGTTGELHWMARGGHRLWTSPEIIPDTYALDNSPVKVHVTDDHITLLQNVEPETGLQKELTLEFTQTGEVKVTHRIANTGEATRLMAPWALTQMAPGGTGIATFPARGGHSEQLLPTNPLVMWAYTDFSDPRWLLTKHYLVLKQDPQQSAPQKAGFFNKHTRAAYLLGSDLFVKRYEANPAVPYPDFNCSFEIFTNGDFLELETLGPLVDLMSGFSATHVEHWSLHRDVHLGELNENELHRVILPIMR
jgi:hypothetical protein